MIGKTIDSPAAVSATAFLVLATLWGASFVAIEAGLSYWPPLLFAGVRYAIAGVIVLAYAAVIAGRWVPRTRGDFLAISVAGTFVIALYHGLLYVGELHISGAVAAVIVSLSPVVTAAFASGILPEERIGPVEVGGFLLGIVGVIIVADPGPNVFHSAEFLGVGLVFIGVVAFSLGAVLLRPLETGVSIVGLQGWAMLVGAAMLLAGSVGTGESIASVSLTPTAIVTLAYLTIASGVIAFLLYFALLDRIGPTQLHLVGYVEPITAAGISWLLLGHVIESNAFIGFLAILAGFFVLKHEEIGALLDARPTWTI